MSFQSALRHERVLHYCTIRWPTGGSTLHLESAHIQTELQCIFPFVSCLNVCCTLLLYLLILHLLHWGIHSLCFLSSCITYLCQMHNFFCFSCSCSLVRNILALVTTDHTNIANELKLMLNVYMVFWTLLAELWAGNPYFKSTAETVTSFLQMEGVASCDGAPAPQPFWGICQLCI